MPKLHDNPSWLPKTIPQRHPTGRWKYLSEGPNQHEGGYHNSELYPFYNPKAKKWQWWHKEAIIAAIAEEGYVHPLDYRLKLHYMGRREEYSFHELAEYYAKEILKAEREELQARLDAQSNRAARQAIIPDADSEEAGS